MGKILKSNLSKFEDEVKEGFTRRLRKEFTGVVESLYDNRTLLVRFQYIFKQYTTLNQLTTVIVESVRMTKESEAPKHSEIPDKTTNREKGYFCCVHVLKQFLNVLVSIIRRCRHK